jgi:hypothetical protein
MVDWLIETAKGWPFIALIVAGAWVLAWLIFDRGVEIAIKHAPRPFPHATLRRGESLRTDRPRIGEKARRPLPSNRSPLSRRQLLAIVRAHQEGK